MRSLFLCVPVLVLLSFVSASPFNVRPFESLLDKRQLIQNTSANGPIVDLGYERYQGVANASTGLNTWKGYMALSTCRQGGALIEGKYPIRRRTHWAFAMAATATTSPKQGRRATG